MIGIDIGTTNWKVGVFDNNFQCLNFNTNSSIIHADSAGNQFYDPEEMWSVVKKLLKKIAPDIQHNQSKSIGITSMAEAGLWIKKSTGECVSHIIPWFDARTVKYFNETNHLFQGFENFKKTGLHNSYKYSIFKNLYLMNEYSGNLSDVVWLSVSDFIAFKLTGTIATEYTLAARTNVFDIFEKEWNYSKLEELGIPTSIFPEAFPSGTKLGNLLEEVATEIGIDKNISVAVAGHDHLCSASAINCIQEDEVYASIGTAEVLIGSFESRSLSHDDYLTGLSFGPHVIANRMTWLGSIQSAGGSIEWARNIFSDSKLEYEDMLELLSTCRDLPTKIMYFPHLSGSGAPNLDVNARASFIGLDNGNTKGEILKSILEGMSYETRLIFETAEKVLQKSNIKIKLVGGGAKNKYLVQTLSDVLGYPITLVNIEETTLLGAAIIANYQNCNQQGKTSSLNKVILPSNSNHLIYSKIFENGFKPIHSSLRKCTGEIQKIKFEEKN